MEAVLADARRYGVTLPAPPGRIRAAVRACRGALAEIDTPVLVHFDIWDANIFIDVSSEPVRVEGLIDPERAFWGDPYADFAVMGLTGGIEHDQDLLAGYREAGGIAEFTAPVRLRLACYRIYLFLIMIVEGTPRGYAGAAHERRTAEWRRRLLADLAGIEAGTR
jgi:fructosamine-3-kinase